MNDSTIRNLTMDDLHQVTRIHRHAFPDSALTLLGAEGVRRYYEWQLIGPHDSVSLGIFQGDRLAGFCFAGVFRGAMSGFLRKNKGYLAWRVLTHPWLIANPQFRQRLDLSWSILAPKKKQNSFAPRADPVRSFGVLAIAVDPDLQGRGIGQQLMLAVEGIALEHGFTRMGLTVAADNRQAIDFYLKSGWHKSRGTNGSWTGGMFKDLAPVVQEEQSITR